MQIYKIYCGKEVGKP